MHLKVSTITPFPYYFCYCSLFQKVGYKQVPAFSESAVQTSTRFFQQQQQQHISRKDYVPEYTISQIIMN